MRKSFEENCDVGYTKKKNGVNPDEFQAPKWDYYYDQKTLQVGLSPDIDERYEILVINNNNIFMIKTQMLRRKGLTILTNLLYLYTDHLWGHLDVV